MRKRFLSIPVLCSVLFLSAVTAPSASALETRFAQESDEKVVVPQGTTITDDFITGGQTVDIKGVIEGDLYAFAETVTISGTVQGDVYAGAKTVDIQGTVSDDLFAVGADVTVSGTIGDNATVLGSVLTFSESAEVGRDLTAAGERLVSNGYVGRFLTIATATAAMDGSALGIRGNSDELTLGSKAVVYGDVEIKGAKEPTYATGAKIEGKKKFQQELLKDGKDGDKTDAILGKIGSWLFGFLGAVLAGAFVLLAMPSLARSSARALKERPYAAFGFGVLVLFAVPLLFLLLLVTVVGVKLAFLLATLTVFFTLASSAPVGLWIGRMILSRLHKSSPALHDLWAMSFGLLVVALLAAVPFVGPVVSFGAMVCGLGAFLLSGNHPVAPVTAPVPPISHVPVSHV